MKTIIYVKLILLIFLCSVSECGASRAIIELFNLGGKTSLRTSRYICEQRRFYCYKLKDEYQSQNIRYNIKIVETDYMKPWLKLRKDLWPHCSEDTHVKQMQEYLRNPTKKIALIATSNSLSLGFLEASIKEEAEGCRDGKVGYLEGLYVLPNYRRHGIASSLTLEAEAWCFSKGCRYIASDTQLNNELSIKFHEDHGYKVTKKLIHFIKDLSNDFPNE